MGKRFLANEAELSEASLGIKLWACPHCRRHGTLTRHGFLRGYDERGPGRVLRGRRVFCSNRYRSLGCGRTFSLLLAAVVAGFVVRAPTLFRFALGFTSGLTRKAAWLAACAGAMSLSSGYRLLRRLRNAQSALRTRLCQHCPPPACAHPEPLAALVAHFRAAFSHAVCPFCDFQAQLCCGLFDGSVT